MLGEPEKASQGFGVLFLCAERVARDPSAGRLMAQAFRPCSLTVIAAPRADGRSFAQRVAAVDRLLDAFPVAAAHGFDAWLLMAAAAERVERKAPVPQLLLFNPILGGSQHLNGALLGYRAPRGRRVRAAFGLELDHDGHPALIERTTYVFGDTDPHSALRDWRYLRGLGCSVHVVRGWHERNRVAIESQLHEIIANYMNDLESSTSDNDVKDHQPAAVNIA